VKMDDLEAATSSLIFGKEAARKERGGGGKRQKNSSEQSEKTKKKKKEKSLHESWKNIERCALQKIRFYNITEQKKINEEKKNIKDTQLVSKGEELMREKQKFNC